jgi:hypothetical protein
VTWRIIANSRFEGIPALETRLALKARADIPNGHGSLDTDRHISTNRRLDERLDDFAFDDFAFLENPNELGSDVNSVYQSPLSVPKVELHGMLFVSGALPSRNTSSTRRPTERDVPT